ncbi:SAM-dependent methyltransferase [Pseudoflavitalea sp. G-6-1-2]|uniref:class I SAM-dependent methyltransferase n=1 Tax=Pseudoflavitalea sp. G-6-1-2 TaxID=2728841 RepID=UPI00146C7267|nr:SAM-dependent methyltransferase [Pseudoflavitalea sp. G-6-1-2]NML22648.1 SAM-dependent methyltransferase [Pseudoflavitalea sp. G-6-1-2]
MKVDKASRTAQYMAFFRALESTRPADKRLFNDPYARFFLDNGLRRWINLSTIPFARKIIHRIAHKRIPGGLSSGVARTRYIDDLLKSTIDKGVKQVIMLGAGFDTRAMRLDFLHNTNIIEIDHPNTAKQKLGAIQSEMGNLPQNTRFYQMDFNEQSLEDLAHTRNIDMSLPTTFIWEGVSNYLTDKAVAGTFAFFEKFASGSYIIFTYVHQQMLDEPHSFFGGEKLLNDLANIEERWTFGWYPEDLPQYLEKYHCTLIEDKGAVEYRDIYMPERPERGYEFYRVAMAERD